MDDEKGIECCEDHPEASDGKQAAGSFQWVPHGLHVGKNIPGTLGLFSTGAIKAKENLVGDMAYRIIFQLQAGMTAYEDYERLKNSDFLLNLTYELDQAKDVEIAEQINGFFGSRVINSISAGNALLFEVPTGDINDGVVYQLQLTVGYTICSND